MRAERHTKPERSCLSRRGAVCLFALVWVLPAAALIGCGGLSLDGLLGAEDPGEFTVQPANGYVSLEAELDIHAQGGWRPYRYEKLSGVGTVDPDTGVYTAPPDTIGGDTAEIQVMDYLDQLALTTVHVFAALTLDKSNVTLRESDPPVSFDADGGIPDYYHYVDGETPHRSTNSTGLFDFDPAAEGAGVHTIEIVDSIGNIVAATVTVVAAQLAIRPSAAWVLDNQTLDYTALNAGTALFSVDTVGGGSIAPLTGTTARYTPPAGVVAQTAVTVRLIDTAPEPDEWVTATVYVFPAAIPPSPLTITPAVLDPVPWGAEVGFTASGGVRPYAFTQDMADGIYGALVQSGSTALYTAPEANTVDWVWLTDTVGATVKVKVRVAK